MKQTKKPFEFDYEEVKNKALAQLKTGKPLLGKEGALGPLFKSFLEAALEYYYPYFLLSRYRRSGSTSIYSSQTTVPF